MSESNRLLDELLHGKYRILRIIGQGGFGRTFLAEDASAANEPRCVIKQFFPTRSNSDQAAELFRLEAQRLQELGSHPQVPSLLEYFESAGNQYIAQEFINGQNLEEELAQNGAFSEAEIRSLLNDLLPVLQFVHERQVIHRDIKPANIIRQSDRTLVLVDFGAAKYAASETVLAKTGTTIGSAEYVAPEQAMGKAVFQSDLYSLGVTSVHLLTQMPPFELMDHGEGSWIWRDFLLQPISEQLGSIIDKLLERGTKKRYQSAAEVLADLEFAPKLHLTVSSSTNATPAEQNVWRKQLVRTIVAGVCVVSIFSLVWVSKVPYLTPTHTPPMTVQVPQADKLPDIQPDSNPLFPDKKASESFEDQLPIAVIISMVKNTVRIFSALIVVASITTAAGLALRRDESSQQAINIGLTGLTAAIAINLMLNLVIPDIEQVTTTTPTEATSQLSPSLEKFPSSSWKHPKLNSEQEKSATSDTFKIPLEWLMFSGLALGGVSAFLIYKRVAKT